MVAVLPSLSAGKSRFNSLRWQICWTIHQTYNGRKIKLHIHGWEVLCLHLSSKTLQHHNGFCRSLSSQPSASQREHIKYVNFNAMRNVSTKLSDVEARDMRLLNQTKLRTYGLCKLQWQWVKTEFARLLACYFCGILKGSTWKGALGVFRERVAESGVSRPLAFYFINSQALRSIILESRFIHGVRQ